jgi:isobutyryl-CoA mutase
VLGAMERQYQRGAIQDDSMKYEQMKHSGALPIVVVNTFLPRDSAAAQTPRSIELTRATEEEKQGCLARLADFHARHAQAIAVETTSVGQAASLPPLPSAAEALARLKQAALSGSNIFAELMNTVQSASLGQITHALYEVGGEYRRNV